ncbi:MAG: hypothetical protein HY306_09760 [Nitrosomonadales bacterium]|nr:hypothetical protein [Nitrosomonadales bacterium]
MKLSRAVFFPLLLACALLFAQQAGAAHTLRHALEDLTQHDAQTSHSDTCQQCADYAQLGNALVAAAQDFSPLLVSAKTLPHITIAFRTTLLLAAVARGPPAPPDTLV